MTQFNSMLLINSAWNNTPSFKLIPITKDCPYQECVFDPAGKVLAIISKTPKEHYAMVPKMDDNGDLVKTKTARGNGKTYKEERRMMNTYAEYYIETMEEIKRFITMFAHNSVEFDYSKYLNLPAAEQYPLVDPALTGMSIVKEEV